MFYTYCKLFNSKIYYCYVDNEGNRHKEIIKDYSPSLFIPSEKGTYKSFTGKKLARKAFKSIYDARNFLQKYEDVENFEIAGFTNFDLTFLADTYSNEIDFDFRKFRIGCIDIETTVSEGFPYPDEAKNPVTAITINFRNKFYVLGTGYYSIERDDVKYVRCKDETTLLITFLALWKKLDLDIITGWNSNNFDIPYLYNRISKILNEECANQLSPFGIVKINEKEISGRKHYVPMILGISCIDYLELYRKFPYPKNIESYKLDYVGELELNEHKLSFEDEGYNIIKFLTTSKGLKVPKDKPQDSLETFERWARLREKISEKL